MRPQDQRMLMKSGAGFTLVQLLLVIFVLGVLLAGSFLLLNNERAHTRDAKRMADMARLQAAFELLYHATASYGQAATDGCNTIGMAVNSCNLSVYLPAIKSFRDPSSGSYIVSQVPSDSGYQITFSLEKSYDSFRAGPHTLSQNGIQ